MPQTETLKAPSPPRSRRVLALVNRKSRNGDDALHRIGYALDAVGVRCDVDAPDSPEAMCKAILEQAEDDDCIVVAGGDGTIRTALGAVIERGLPLGIVPLGTANDLARTLGIPASVDEACRVIAGGHTSRIDVGRANDAWFLNAASFGLSEAVTQRLSGEVKRRWGILGYPICVLDALRATRSFRIAITCDGERHEFRSIQCVIGNGRHYGGGATLAADAAIDDGWLDVYSLDPQGFSGLAALALPLLFGRYQRLDQVRNFRCRRVSVETRSRKHVDTDGEMTTRTPLQVELHPGALEVFVPSDAEPPGLQGKQP